MSAPSLRQLRALSAPATVEDDAVGACYRVTAPAGKRFEEGLHEYVVWYEERQWKAEAKVDVAEILNDPTYAVEDCTDPDCEWCSAA